MTDLLSLKETLREQATRHAKNSFLAYVKLIAPFVIPEGFVGGNHIDLICDRLQKVEQGDIKRLMIFMPPRSMKSRLGSILFPSWVLGKHPTQELMSLSYGKDLATDFSREVRNIVKSEEYAEIFPKLALRADSRAAHRWHTTAGGVYISGGITSGIAGKGAHIAIIDDPLSEQDAMSKASRDYVKNWYPSGLRTRLAPGGRIILIMTRWHTDDLAGWLIEQQKNDKRSDKWEVLEIPAIIDEQRHSKQIALPIGSSYWPERWDKEALEVTKANMPPSQWLALYMQRPIPDEGGIFKRQWFEEWPYSDPPKCEYVVTSVDTAHATGKENDYSACTTWGIFFNIEELTNGRELRVPNLVLLSGFKERLAFHELRQRIIEVNRAHHPDTIIIENSPTGGALISELQRLGLPIHAYRPDRDKRSRAHAASPMVEAGRVWLPKNRSWSSEFLDEVSIFPSGAHDDYTDTFSQAILWVRDNWKLTGPGDLLYGYETPPRRKIKTYWSTI